ncbi:hypothetical protein [Janibacter sp. GXQ6167]|uniref:hypothetical protein n=1 Tax=Janibacter sp. GXQ6167 TaxID=3240791 RepID=UPI00352658C2
MIARALVSAVVVAFAVAGVAACTDESSPTTSADGTSEHAPASTPPTAPGRDVSEELLAYDQPEPIASTSGDLETSFGQRPVTLEILQLRSTPTGTVLTWRLKVAKSTGHDIDRLDWINQPRLIDPAAKEAYLVDTAGHPFADEGRREITVSTGDSFAGPGLATQQGLYPPLPKDLTEVRVSMPGLDPVTVPVTR